MQPLPAYWMQPTQAPHCVHQLLLINKILKKEVNEGKNTNVKWNRGVIDDILLPLPGNTERIEISNNHHHVVLLHKGWDVFLGLAPQKNKGDLVFLQKINIKKEERKEERRREERKGREEGRGKRKRE